MNVAYYHEGYFAGPRILLGAEESEGFIYATIYLKANMQLPPDFIVLERKHHYYFSRKSTEYVDEIIQLKIRADNPCLLPIIPVDIKATYRDVPIHIYRKMGNKFYDFYTAPRTDFIELYSYTCEFIYFSGDERDGGRGQVSSDNPNLVIA